MVMPSGRRSSEPVPLLKRQRQRAEQRGQRRHHDRAEAQQAGLRGSRRAATCPRALRLEREVDHHDRVLLDDADQQHDADQRDRCDRSMPQSISASSAPTPADGSVDRIVIGWM